MENAENSVPNHDDTVVTAVGVADKGGYSYISNNCIKILIDVRVVTIVKPTNEGFFAASLMS